jgi:peptidoglycan/xylan/chitin deacetylase (PgdA/CDA1 family)
MQPPPAQSPGSERSSYSSIHVDGPYIALTFDDGPRPNEKGKSGNEIGFTPKLLDILKERHIHATFFVLGNMVQSHPEILRREAAEGHEIGNHSWSHLPLTKVVQREGGLHHELADTSELITQTIGKPVTLMRPPYGATNPRLSKAIEREYGMKVILWSVDPDDWKDPGASVVSSRILNGWKQSGGTKPGAIILTHDIHKGTIEAMPAMLDALLAKGYKFVTVSELLAMESKNPIPSPTPSAQQASKSKQNQS